MAKAMMLREYDINIGNGFHMNVAAYSLKEAREVAFRRLMDNTRAHAAKLKAEAAASKGAFPAEG